MKLYARQKELDLSPDAFGTLRESNDIVADAAAIQARMTDDGYLFFRGVLDRALVLASRRECVARLDAAGRLEPGTDPMDAVPRRSGEGSYFWADLADGNEPLHQLLYAGTMITLFERLLGGSVLHFDFTWMRAVTPGGGTAPHCDLVYMGRGTHSLYTAWTPLGDIPQSVGGLIVLEGSHRRTELTGEYLAQDVDTYCLGGPGEEGVTTGKIHWEHYQRPGEPWDGAFSHDPPALREQLGGRWLTADYRMGDVLIFSMATLHASLDNQGDTIRLSSDTRYQRADQPVDPRWMNGPHGEKPIAHGLAAKKGRIC